MRYRAWALIALALALALAGLTQGAGSDEPGVPREVPWWGPDGFQEGWTLRVPVVVENTGEGAATNRPVQVDLNLQELAIEAGWPTGRTGERQLLKSFHLQPESVRVVEYTNFRLPRQGPSDASLVEVDPSVSGPDRYTIPARAEPVFLERTPPGPYDPESNPFLSVRWTPEGPLDPGETRSFMVYLEIRQHGSQSPQDAQRVQKALGGQHWISRGHEVYASGERATVLAFYEDTEVEIQTYDGLGPERTEIEDGPNPFTLDAGESRQVFLGSDDELFRVLSSKPVIAGGQELRQGRNAEKGFVPSEDGTIRGTEFEAVVSPDRYFVYATTPRGAAGTFNGQSFRTEGLVTEVYVRGDSLRLSVDEPVIVQGGPSMTRYQFASLSGAPVGSHLVGTAHGKKLDRENGGWEPRVGNLWLGAMDEASLVARTIGSNAQEIVPQGGGSGSTLAVEPGGLTMVRGRSAWGYGPIEVQAASESSPEGVDTNAPLVAFGGPMTSAPLPPVDRGPVSSPIGGLRAQSFTSPVDADVVAFYDRTRVEAVHGSGETEVTVLERGQRLRVTGSNTKPFNVHASKPVAVVPTDGTAYGAGRLDSLPIRVGELQYRGHAVSLTPTGDAQEPIVKTSTFGEETTYEFVVENRGRETDGSNLPDTIEISRTSVPGGWNATLSDTELTLDSGETARVNLTVTPPQTRTQGNRLQLKIAATSTGNPRMKATVETVTVLKERRDVGAWYETVDGPQSLITRFDPGEEKQVPLVVKNEGSSPDEIRLTITGSQVGWTAELLDDGEPKRQLSLGPGETTTLALTVGAPPRGSLALPTKFTVTASSTNDTTATDKVLFDGTVRAESKLALRTGDDLLRVRPGGLARFDLDLANEGNASTDVQLNTSLSAPPSWPTPVFRFRGESLAPVDNRLSSVPPTGSDPVDLTLEVDVPPNASGRQNVKLLVSATPSQGAGRTTVELPLNVFVEDVVSLDVETPRRVLAPPGDRTSWNLTLVNEGNVNATLGMLSDSVPARWLLEPPALVATPLGEPVRASGYLGVPAGAAPTNETVTLRITHPNGTSQTVGLPVTVPAWRGLSIAPLSNVTLVPGVATNVSTTVENVGNRPSTVDVDVDAPDGWSASARAQPSVLAPLERGRLVVELHPSQDAGQATTNVTLTHAVDPGERPPDAPPPETTAFTVRTRVPDLVARNATAHVLEQDGPATVRGSVVNEGAVTVEDVTVAVTDGRRTLATVDLSRVPPGTPRLATMQLPTGVSPTDTELTLVVDPADRVPEASEENNAVPVRTARAQAGAPLPAVPVVLAALAGVAVLAGRVGSRDP